MASNFDALFGEVPFGMCRREDGALSKDNCEQEVLAKIEACVSAGVPVLKIVEILCGTETEKGGKDGR